MTETRDHMTHLTTQWESWQTHVSTSRQFKTQWHQFIQDARKVCNLTAYSNNPKYWDRQAFANSVDPDQMLQNI